MYTIVGSAILLAVFGLLFYWLRSRSWKNKGGNVADYGIQTFDNSGAITFNTTERLFKYIGSRNVKYGKFSFTVSEAHEGEFIFIVKILNSVHRGTPVAFGTNLPNLIHLKDVQISGKTISGEVTCIFNWNLSVDNSDYVQIMYGAY